VTQLSDLDYETIENAVMETARGRWFLAEHQKRHAQSISTPTLLDAIGRLEKIISSIGNDFPHKQAPETETAKPSAMPAPVEVSPTPPAQPLKDNSLSEENLQFFANDEDLFSEDNNALMSEVTATNSPQAAPEPQTASQAAPNPTPQEYPTPEDYPTPEEYPTPQEDSERFKIFKVGGKDKPDEVASTAPSTPEIVAQADAPDVDTLDETAEVPELTMQPTPEEQDRIIVIRNSADSDINIPLAEDYKDPAASEKSTSSNS